MVLKYINGNSRSDAQVVEFLRSIAELMVWGDQHQEQSHQEDEIEQNKNVNEDRHDDGAADSNNKNNSNELVLRMHLYPIIIAMWTQGIHLMHSTLKLSYAKHASYNRFLSTL